MHVVGAGPGDGARGVGIRSGCASSGSIPPGYTATLYRRDAPVIRAEFGAINPQKVLQYMKLQGRDEVYLMSRFVGQEWEQALREASAQ